MIAKDTKFHCKFNHAPRTQIQKEISKYAAGNLIHLISVHIKLYFEETAGKTSSLNTRNATLAEALETSEEGQTL